MKKLSLDDIRTSFLLLGAVDPRFGKFYTGGLSMHDHIGLLPSLDGSTGDFDRYNLYKKYIDLFFFTDYCKQELACLSMIVKTKEDLESEAFKEWLFDAEGFYYSDVFDLSREFVDEKDTEEHFYLAGDEWLEKKGFQPLMDFCEVMDHLLTAEYNLAAEIRTPLRSDLRILCLQNILAILNKYEDSL